MGQDLAQDHTQDFFTGAKQLAILPTLLRGKLLDHYVCLSDDEKRDAGTLKTALMKHAGHPLADTLLASRMFGERTQGPKETVSDYVSDLKKLFKLAHPTEAKDSIVLIVTQVYYGFATGHRHQPTITDEGAPGVISGCVEDCSGSGVRVRVWSAAIAYSGNKARQ